MARYPVFILATVSVVGFILAIAVLLGGFAWLSFLIFVVTTLVLCLLIAAWSSRSRK